MAYCPNCRAQVDASTPWCPNCGAAYGARPRRSSDRRPAAGEESLSASILRKAPFIIYALFAYFSAFVALIDFGPDGGYGLVGASFLHMAGAPWTYLSVPIMQRLPDFGLWSFVAPSAFGIAVNLWLLYLLGWANLGTRSDPPGAELQQRDPRVRPRWIWFRRAFLLCIAVSFPLAIFYGYKALSYHQAAERSHHLAARWLEVELKHERQGTKETLDLRRQRQQMQRIAYSAAEKRDNYAFAAVLLALPMCGAVVLALTRWIWGWKQENARERSQSKGLHGVKEMIADFEWSALSATVLICVVADALLLTLAVSYTGSLRNGLGLVLFAGGPLTLLLAWPIYRYLKRYLG